MSASGQRIVVLIAAFAEPPADRCRPQISRRKPVHVSDAYAPCLRVVYDLDRVAWSGCRPYAQDDHNGMDRAGHQLCVGARPTPTHERTRMQFLLKNEVHNSTRMADTPFVGPTPILIPNLAPKGPPLVASDGLVRTAICTI